MTLGKVAVLMGGSSAERPVSLMSGGGVLAALQGQGVDAHSFDPATFEQYTGFYVAGFARVCVALAQSANGELGVLFPSSVAIAGAPREFCEYAMAKAAGEVLCCYLAQKHKLRIVTPRFPRLLTDQTATVVPTDTGSIEQLVLAGIRSLHRSRTPASSPASIR